MEKEKTQILKQSRLMELVMPFLEAEGIIFQKQKHILAKVMEGGERIETITGDGKETINTAEEGDFLVKNMTEAGEMYLVSARKFEARYTYLQDAGEGFSEYRSTGKVIALELTPEILDKLNLSSPFHFEAPWGERMIAKDGDFLAMPPDKSEVYRIARVEFFETYALLT